MNYLRLIAYALLIAGLASVTLSAQDKTFGGEVTDENLNCTQNPMKGPADVTKDKVACILYWTKFAGPKGKYVLYDAATKTTYQLDRQDWAEPFIGAKVIVTGSESDKAIKITDIKVDESAYKTGAGS
jgi:hypothetical protein